MVSLKGPSEIKTKTSKILFDAKNPSILRATYYFNGKGIELNENKFNVNIDRRRDELMIYHTYYYITDNTKMVGRWYDNVPLDTFRVLVDTTYTHTILRYEDDHYNSATAVIELTEEAKNILQEAF